MALLEEPEGNLEKANAMERDGRSKKQQHLMKKYAGNYMKKYAGAFQKYTRYNDHHGYQGSAKDANDTKELGEWRAARLADNHEYIPSEYRHFADDKVEKTYKE